VYLQDELLERNGRIAGLPRVCDIEFQHWPRGRVPGHLNYETLMAHRTELECGRIVITHMSENMLDHLTEVELEAAADGTVIEV